MNTVPIAMTDAVIERVQRRLVDDGAEPTPTALARALRAESTVLVSDAEMLRLIRMLQRELVGAGPLAELLADPNTTDVVATIEDILGLGRMSQFDHYGRPLREIWEATPDLTPYTAIRPSVPLDEKNPRRGALAEASKMLVLDKVDMADEELFNRILWKSIKGDAPFPGTKRMSALEAKIAQ